jgi:glucose 1-dehydrogenase
MRAVCTVPSSSRLDLLDVPEPVASSATDVVLRVLEVGVCGTDREIAAFEYGTPPDGEDHLVVGHECLAEVLEVGSAVDGVAVGDLVVPMVRRPCDEATCAPCVGGRADYCRTGDYTERGIKQRHGYMTERVVEDQAWLHVVPPHLRDVGVLTEPLTIAQKALAQLRLAERRLPAREGEPLGAGRTALVLGAGPVGQLGVMALLAEGYRTFVYSRSPAPNDKAALAEALGATYVSSQETDVAGLLERTGGPVDVVYEAVGVASVAVDVLSALGPNGVFVFTGVARPEPPATVDVASLNRRLVLGNQVVLGTVNAGAADYRAAVAGLAAYVDRWGDLVGQVVTGRHPLEAYEQLLTGPSRGIKDVLQVGA